MLAYDIRPWKNTLTPALSLSVAMVFTSGEVIAQPVS